MSLGIAMYVTRQLYLIETGMSSWLCSLILQSIMSFLLMLATLSMTE